MEDEVVTQTINVGEIILNTINSLCSSLFSSIDSNILPELDNLIFMDTTITETTYMERILGTDFNTGLLALAYSLLLAFIIYYAVKRFTSFYVGKEIESPYQFLIKAVVIAIITTFSYTICSNIISFTYEITEFVCDLGKKVVRNKYIFLYPYIKTRSKIWSV